MNDDGQPLASPPAQGSVITLVLGALLLLLAGYLILYDLSHSNRPHELRFVPWVVGILALNLVLLVRSLRRLGGPNRRPMLFSGTIVLLVVDGALLVPAVATLVS